MFASICFHARRRLGGALPHFFSLATIHPMKEEKRRAQSGALAPAAAFAILLLLIAAGAAAYVLTRTDEIGPAPAVIPQGTTSPPDHQLTDAEALAEFQRLDALRQRAFEERDLELLGRVFTETSPSAPALETTIRRFRAKGVFADERLRVVRETLVDNGPEEIRVEQVVVLDIVFKDAAGRDITKEGGKERQKVRWIVRYEDSAWRLHDGLIVAARPIP